MVGAEEGGPTMTSLSSAVLVVLSFSCLCNNSALLFPAKRLIVTCSSPPCECVKSLGVNEILVDIVQGAYFTVILC